MSAVANAFEQTLIDASFTHLIRCTDEGVVPLINNGLALGMFGTPVAGADMLPSEGIFAPNSCRLSGGSPGTYIRQAYGSAVCPTAGLTIAVIMTAPRNPTPATGEVALFGCTQSGGYSFYLAIDGTIIFNCYMNGAYRLVSIPRTALKTNGSFVHITNDLRYLKIYVDGVLKSTTDIGQTMSIQYSSADVFIGAESNGSSIDNSYPLADMDVALFGVAPYALDASKIAQQFNSLQSISSLSGTALLDNGSPAIAIRVSEWSGSRNEVISPGSSGAWQADVPAGDYLLTAIGPAGYRPVSHGPVTAVDP